MSLLFYLFGVFVVFLCGMRGTGVLLLLCLMFVWLVLSSDMLWLMDPFVMFP